MLVDDAVMTTKVESESTKRTPTLKELAERIEALTSTRLWSALLSTRCPEIVVVLSFLIVRQCLKDYMFERFFLP